MEEKIILNESILSSVLQVNNIDITTLRENEKKTNYFKKLSNFSPLLLIISCNYDKKYSPEISLNAAIQLKNYIKSFWKNNEKDISIINDDNILICKEDKEYLRVKILEAIIYVIDIENMIILKQYKQCLKTILKYDFRENKIENKQFISKTIEYLSSKNIKQIYAGIIIFGQLSKIFEFDNEENQIAYNNELIKVNNYLLSSLYECTDINNTLQANFAYKIIKIFFRSFQGAIPELFTQEQIFEKWINFIINCIKTPISENNINENENLRKNIFFRLKRVCYQTITRIMQKYSKCSNKIEKNQFEKMINNKYINIFLELYKTIFVNHFNNKVFIDNYGKTCIYNFFSIIMENKSYNKNVIQLFINDNNNILLNYIINDCFLSYDDIELWSTDPKKYLAEKVEEINSILTKRYNACKLFSSLFTYKEKKNGKPVYYEILYEFLCKTLINEENNLNSEKKNLVNNLNNKPYYSIYNNINYCLRKESILYIIKSNSDLILKYSKNNFENFIEKIIFPELSSPCALLREQASNFFQKFKNYIFKDENLIENIIKSLSYLMQNDPFLPVRFESAITLSSLLNQKKVKEMLKGEILPLLQIYIKLMEETDLEEIMNSLQEVIQNFTEESKIYIVHLSEYLIKYFNKLLNSIIDGDKEDNNIDEYSLINNIINTFCNFIHYFVNNNDIYPKIENYVNDLIDFCIILQPEDKLEEGLGILKEILFNCQALPKNALKYFIPLINLVVGENDLPNLDIELYGSENISDISNLICFYINKDYEENLIKMIDNKGNQYINYLLKYIKYIVLKCDKKNIDYYEYIYIFNICNNLFDKYKGKVDYICEEILNIILSKYKNNKNKELLIYICLLLSLCFIYYPQKSLFFFQKNCCLKDIFMFWFFELDKIKKYRHLKFNLFAICSIISLDQKQQDKIIFENIKLFVNKILELIEKIWEKIEKEEKNKIKEKKDEDEEEEENEDLDGDELFKKFIIEGKSVEEEEEEDDDWEENDQDDEYPETEVDKQDPILMVKSCFELINKNFNEMFNKIIEILSDKVNKLKDIFYKREEKIKNNMK